MPQPANSLLTLVASIVGDYVGNNETPTQALPGLIRDVWQALVNTGTIVVSGGDTVGRMPAASHGGSGRQTVFDDHLVCLDCGMHMKMLKRHLQTVHNQTPAQYRAKFNLPGDYPMVARQYAALRSSLAKESGLGKRPKGRS